LIGLSLCVKHLLFVFPAWLALKEPTWRRKLVAGGLPVAIFLASFAPWWQAGHAGIAEHVFGYRSFENAPVWQVLLPRFLYGALPMTVLFVTALALAGMALRGWDRWHSLLAYLVALVVFAPAIANQYLAIPVAALAVWWNRPFRVYTVLAALFILFQADGLGLARLLNPAATLYGPITQLAYTACTVVLGAGLVLVTVAPPALAAVSARWHAFTAWLEREIAAQLRAPL